MARVDTITRFYQDSRTIPLLLTIHSKCRETLVLAAVNNLI